MEPDMKVCGKTTYSTAEVRKAGQMDQFTLENILQERNMEEVFTVGTTEVNMMASGLRTK